MSLISDDHSLKPLTTLKIMAGPFSKNAGPEPKTKRDTHDLSFQNNSTYKFGYLYPCMCCEVSAGDSWHIDPAFGLRFLPTYFPLQTKMKAKIDFFYVRFRNLWTDWMNYRYGTGNPGSFPVLSPAEALEQSKTGSLGDYLGLPTTLVGDNINIVNGSITSYMSERFGLSAGNFQYPGTDTYRSFMSTSSGKIFIQALTKDAKYNLTDTSESIATCSVRELLSQPLISTSNGQYYSINTSSKLAIPTNDNYNACSVIYSSGKGWSNGSSDFNIHPDSNTWVILSDKSIGVKKGYIEAANLDDFIVLFLYNVDGNLSSGNLDYSYNLINASYNLFKVVEATDVFKEIPYSINALPFRAYEQIYNAFYRDDRNNPYMVNGVYDPNVFIPTKGSGVDDNKYRLRKRNWEQDFLTSAVSSPQYGNAPLVGITSTGSATFKLDDGTEVTSQLEVSKDGETITGFSTTPDAGVNKQLINLASEGISINDLRGVNSMQRYLENCLRRGLRYRDQMMAHRGIDVRYDELDMPEFIGSIVQNVDVSQVNQTSAGDSDPLGSYAGQLSAVGGGSTLHHYCDEDGVLLGILSVVPVPSYSQLLPKLFTKVNEPLEYYMPEFQNLGMQAIPYREVCPLQAANSGVSLDSTFGYNRAWYDYMQHQDEIHGQFRTTLHNYVMARVFNSVPSLNEEFLTVDPSQLNDVFSVSEVTLDDGTKVHLDTILGQIHFKISVERQIKRYAIPSLE